MTASRYMAVVLVSDLSRAVEFYTCALGLRRHDEWQGQWAELWCGEQLLALWTGRGDEAAIRPDGAAPGAAGSTYVAFKVDDIERCAERVVSCGGRIEPELRAAPHGRMRLVRDPDGNPLLLHHPLRPLEGW